MTEKKIRALHEMGAIVRELKKKGKRIVQCHGVFDLLHPGHIRHFAAAKKNGDVLVVTVTSDRHVHKGPGRPIFNEKLRAESVASLAAVDYVAINDAPTAAPAIKVIRPNFYIKGSEFRQREKDFTRGIDAEANAVSAVGGKVEFTDDITFSSTKLINNHLAPYPEAAQAFLRDFQKKHSFEDIAKFFEKIKNYRVLVIGEAIIDDYHYVRAMNKSPKEMIIATRYESSEAFAGGALACANHIAGYCANVDLVTCIGKRDSRERFIRKSLKQNVRPIFFYNPAAPTIVNRRFIDPVFLTKMFQVYFFNNSFIPVNVEKNVERYVRRNVANYDLVLVADYGHGFLTPCLISAIAKHAPFLALNTQTNSANLGFNMVTKYPRADYVCIDHYEARLSAREREVASLAGWNKIISDMTRKLGAKRAVITLGHDGCISYDKRALYQVPVFSTRVLDRVGAGDALFSITAPLVRAGMPAEAVGFVGNAAGALAVTIVGNKQSVEPIPLLKSINTMLKN